MITATRENLKSALTALYAAEYTGTQGDFEDYQIRVMLGEIRMICRALDPDYYSPPLDIDAAPFPFEDTRQ